MLVFILIILVVFVLVIILVVFVLLLIVFVLVLIHLVHHPSRLFFTARALNIQKKGMI